MSDLRFTPEAKQKVIAALRSGEYKQGTYGLHSQHNDESYFCFWGVVCDVSKQMDWIMRPEPCSPTISTHRLWGSYGLKSKGGSSLVTPPKVVAWLLGRPFNRSGQLDYVPYYKDRSGNSLAFSVLNDCRELTFDQLADMVEYFF